MSFVERLSLFGPMIPFVERLSLFGPMIPFVVEVFDLMKEIVLLIVFPLSIRS